MSNIPWRPTSPILLDTLLDGDQLAAANAVAVRYGCPTVDGACTVGHFLRLSTPMPLITWCYFVGDLREALGETYAASRTLGEPSGPLGPVQP